MKHKSDILPLPEKVRTPIEELEVLAELEGTQYFQVLKRVARRYTENLKTQSFTLNATSPNFQINHTRFVEQAVGMNLLIRVVEEARRKINDEEKNGDK